MKELNEVNYNNYKSFNELIERLESVKDAIKKQNYGIAMDILSNPYPGFQITTSTELKESEDKQIMKEEDENMVRYIGNAITCKESVKYLEEKGVDMIKAHRWLESLKPQKHWKPSEKQINALSDVLSIKDIKYDVLSELLECLKKLK